MRYTPIILSAAISILSALFVHFAAGQSEVSSFFEQTNTHLQEASNLQLAEVFNLLPEPEEWPALIDQAKDWATEPREPMLSTQRLLIYAGLLMLADANHELRRDAAKEMSACSKRLKGNRHTMSGKNQILAKALEEAAQIVLEQPNGAYDDKADFAEFLKTVHAKPRKTRFRLPWQRPIEQEVKWQTFPPLLKRFDKEEARGLIKRALQKKVIWKLPEDRSTTQLIFLIYVDSIEELALPQWDIVANMDDPEVFFTVYKRFHQKQKPDQYEWSFWNAYGNALMTGFAAGKYNEYEAYIREFPWTRQTLYVQLDRPAYTDVERSNLFDALVQVLHEYPQAKLWGMLSQLAIRLNRTADLVAIARLRLELPEISPAERYHSMRTLTHAYLADGQLEPAIELLKQSVDYERQNWSEPTHKDQIEASEQLIQLGSLLENPTLIDFVTERQLPVLRKQMTKPNRLSVAINRIQKLSRQLNGVPNVDWKPWAELTATILSTHTSEYETILNTVEGNSYDRFRRLYRNSTGGLRDLTLLQLFFLFQQGEHAQLLEHVDTTRFLGVSDLTETLDSYEFTVPVLNKPLAWMIAVSLAETGQTEKARSIVEALLPYSTGDDAAYALHLAITPSADAIAFYDQLYSTNAFEERPLIWKGKALFKLERFENAREVAQKAISIDPSDGEQGRGTRMRVYDLLGRIAQTEGQLEDAEFFGQIIAAIRQSEDADQFWEAGLLPQAISMYLESLELFADAYCIQSRVALRLVEQGRLDEAETHYQRAFELMPESFGRVESHCFGCEGAFDSELAQSVAERVFDGMIRDGKVNPQLYYLFGYLRQSEGKDREAAQLFQKAVELDPLYLNAWTKLGSLSDAVHLSMEERQTIALTLLKLDPLRHNGRPDWTVISDKAQVWEIGKTTLQWSNLYTPKTSLYAFPASAEQLEHLNSLSQDEFLSYSSIRRSHRNRLPGPGYLLVQLPGVKDLSDAIRYSGL